nr:type I restriction modification DNA specificity domain protein [Cedratvirus plubellavi]
MQSSLSFDLILLALQSINNSDLDSLSVLLEKFPIEVLDVERSDALLAQFLNTAARERKEKEALLVYQRWERTYPSQEISFFATLFRNNLFEDYTYKFLANTFKETSFLEVVSDLSKGDSNEDLIRTLDNVFQAYGEQNKDRLDIALAEADSSGNSVMYNYLYEKALPLQEVAPKPEWVNTDEGKYGSDLPTSEQLEEEAADILNRVAAEDIPLPRTETLVDFLVAGMEADGIAIDNIEEARNVLRASIVQLTPEQLNDLTKGRIEEALKTENLNTLQTNTELFRILGPSNPQIGAGMEDFLTSQDRMFTCSLYDYDEDEDETEDWFLGYCLVCSRKIENYWYAVRAPHSQGGWSGCYCSFEHTRQDLLNRDQPRLSDVAILDLVEIKTKQTGIQDRI